MKICRNLTVLMLCGCACAAAVAAEAGGQTEKKPTAVAARPATPEVLKIFRLKNTLAAGVRDVLAQVFGQGTAGYSSRKSPRFAFEPQSNTLIANVADLETLKDVEVLIAQLDRPQEQANSGPRLMTFQLKYIKPLEAERAIQQLSLVGASSYSDSRTGSLVVSGGEEAINRVRLLINRLDVPVDAPRDADASIRIVWLVDKSLADKATPRVPDDLSPQIEKLRNKLGLDELQMAAQMIVNVSPAQSTPFKSSGTAMLKQIMNLQCTGTLTRSDSETTRLDLHIDATQANSKEKSQCALNTTCSVVQGQPVIVGMTTLGSHPSVFVIELLPK